MSNGRKAGMHRRGRCAIAALLLCAAGSAQADDAMMAPADAAPPPVATIPVEAAPAQEPLKSRKDKDDKSGAARLDDVVVTADYRPQGVQDVAGSAQAFDGQQLDQSGAAGMQDYLLQVPSVSLQPSGNGKLNIAMRGVSNINASDLGFNDGSPTVGVYLNDVAVQGSGVFPDLRIFDLDRIEVLKGPQGTLYGEGSMGGSIKMVTAPVDYSRWVVRGEAMYDLTAGGAPGNEVRGALNIPLVNDTLGLRLVGTDRLDGGFVDYTQLGLKNANSDRTESARAILSWKPTQTLGLDYTFLYNRDQRNQFPVVDEGKQQDM
ncbi:MAG TPA: TonB-dependent receptor plug domain-containing protein, partial [Nevskiaceae bacterium]|nr:TonB-dependent receptor plug domain-containing protein [Nevskiaceae bacterium]